MKLKLLLYLLVLGVTPLQASKVLSITLKNMTGEDVVVQSFSLKKSVMLKSSHEEGDSIPPTKCLKFYVKHRNEDFEEMRGEKRWVLSDEDDNFVILNLNGMGSSLYWKAYILSETMNNNLPQFGWEKKLHENLKIRMAGKRMGWEVIINGKAHIIYYSFLGILRKA